ncbi:MAG: hypothetical protein ACTSW1_05990 [Candidatus Hodarchaeales archaeon]
MEPRFHSFTFKKEINPYKVPFNTFLIWNQQTGEINFYSQALAYQIGIDPSTISIPLQSFEDHIQYVTPIQGSNYKIFKFTSRVSTSIFEENLEKCIHELRTSSQIINLGYTVTMPSHSRDNKIFDALHRQELATIVASDLLYLLGISKDIHTVPLSTIINEAINCSGNKAKMYLYVFNSLVSNFHSFSNPLVWGDQQFLINFFRTILYWIDSRVLIELEIRDPVTILISFNTDTDLSQRTSYKMIVDYIYYVASYFNFRSWIQQQTIHFLMPLTQI